MAQSLFVNSIFLCSRLHVDEPQTKENNYFQTKKQFKPKHFVHTVVDPDVCGILKKVLGAGGETHIGSE